MLITILKCFIVSVGLAIFWLFGYLMGVKLAVKYAVEMMSRALMELVEEQDGTAEVQDFADRLSSKMSEIF